MHLLDFKRYMSEWMNFILLALERKPKVPSILRVSMHPYTELQPKLLDGCINSFIWVFDEYLLCTKLYFIHWKYQNRQIPILVALALLQGLSLL